MKSCCDNPGCTAPPHKIGTSHMYHRKKCRCDSCREAAKKVRNKVDNRKRMPSPTPNPEASMDWQDRAACIGVDINVFFPYDETSTGPRAVTSASVVAQKEEALSYCNKCEVRNDCLRVALDSFERGIWGGTDHRDRAAIRAAIQRNENQPSPEVKALRADLVEKSKGTPREKLMELTTLVANIADQYG